MSVRLVMAVYVKKTTTTKTENLVNFPRAKPKPPVTEEYLLN